MTLVRDNLLDSRRLQAVRRALLRWYDREARVLPWRVKRGEVANPYHVLVSEAMLQQTQVATVIDYFNRFVGKWPQVEDLAAADEQAVLHLWQGLGYYRRARNLHHAARTIVTEYGGQVPAEATELLKLPGVGRYTAGAIASIAYGQREPIVDGNVKRVLARWFAIKQPVEDKPVVAELWRLAEQVVSRTRPGDFNQAMMELGATICTPRGPECERCAVKRWCEARRLGIVDKLPTAVAKTKAKAVTHHVLAIEKNGRVLFEQRDDNGLWAGMWQLVTMELEKTGAVEPDELTRWARQRVGLSIDGVTSVGRFTHITTHRRITFVVWRAKVQGGRLKRGAGIWRRLSEVKDLPMSNAQKKAIQFVV